MKFFLILFKLNLLSLSFITFLLSNSLFPFATDILSFAIPFFVINNEIITPKLNGTILPGITRLSVIELAYQWGIKVHERKISIDELLQGIHDRKVSEVFGTGTAAVISPVSILRYKGQSHVVGNGEIGHYAKLFFEALTQIQYGEKFDKLGWIETIG